MNDLLKDFFIRFFDFHEITKSENSCSRRGKGLSGENKKGTIIEGIVQEEI